MVKRSAFAPASPRRSPWSLDASSRFLWSLLTNDARINHSRIRNRYYVLCRLLRAYHYCLHAGRHVTFSTLHTLTMVTDCPPAFLLLGMYSSPSDVLLKETSAGNLPIHNVAAWELDDEEESICRKSMSWATLMAVSPESADVKNDFGETA